MAAIGEWWQRTWTDEHGIERAEYRMVIAIGTEDGDDMILLAGLHPPATPDTLAAWGWVSRSEKPPLLSNP